MNVNDCSGSSYAVMKDFSIMDPTTAPTDAAGATTGGFCSTNETYRTYVAWCNESGCTAVSPASLDYHPASGTTNLITLTRGTIPTGATAWAMYYSKASESHTKIRNCSSFNAYLGTVAASSTTGDCKCLSLGGQQQSANQTGLMQVNKLDPNGTIKVSSKDGTVQSKLTAEKAILDLTTDLVPRFSPDAGTNYRTVDWNSATVYTVEKNFGASTSVGLGRTVFRTVTDALTAITDSSYTKPYVIKLRSKDGTELDATTVNKPYVWIQGDGATRIQSITVMADGVRVSGVVTQAMFVGDSGFESSPSDIDNIWIDRNVVTNGPTLGQCHIQVHVGGGTRTHGVFVSNNRLGGANDPAATSENRCYLQTLAGSSGAGTLVTFSNNFVESHQCIHGYNALGLDGDSTGTADTATTIVSSHNTFVCDVVPGITEQGEDFSCLRGGGAFGFLRSIDDTCIINRQDAGPYHHHYTLMQTDQSYLGTVPRVAEFTNPTFIVNLPPLRLRCDRVPIPSRLLKKSASSVDHLGLD
jgi:hypothetical protein